MKDERNISTFLTFLITLANQANIKIDEADLPREGEDYQVVSNVLNKISEYFYQTNVGLDKAYFSEFHKYWQINHEEIINPQIDKNACYEVAKVLEELYQQNDIKVQLDTLDLAKEDIANVRFFTTIQDFKIDINAKVNPFELFKRFPELFNPIEIVQNEANINKLLNFLGATDQGDKRQKWMSKSAQLLIEKYDAKAINIAKKNDKDVLLIIKSLTEEQEKYGFSEKKAHMFVRDLLDLKAWQGLSNIDKLDAISDQNTMRIALRTGILKTSIPLLSSFLDVYCYQYGLIDRQNRSAWREVWTQWARVPGNHRPLTPASFDYLIYRMGKLACKRTARICSPNKEISASKLRKLSAQDKLIFVEGYCIFNSICKLENKILNPPRSISRKGRTGWDNAKTNEGGGGGLSS